jgi:predicted metal-dependent hydrolase
MKSRWGSCSSEGEVCFNLLLMQAGLPQIDFVIAHELCHIRHFAHNASFYALLEEVMPDWKEREILLRQAI